MADNILLVIDNDPTVLHGLEGELKGWTLSGDANPALARAVLLEVNDAAAGIRAIADLRKANKEIAIIAIAGPTDWAKASVVLQHGAFDYLDKPLDPVNVTRALKRVLQAKPDAKPVWELVGVSPAVHKLHGLVKRISPTDSTVLILGESGTGKELIARAVHNNSNRYGKPYVTVNCGAFTATLLESELFGHVKGAFTGADRTKQGLVEVADGGTFFLDEIGEMPIDLQVKLLRLLEEREFIPVGANKTTKVDVRFVCATNRDLAAEVQRGNFREDLFYRLNVIPLHLPPLNQRGEDILVLADFFISMYGSKMNSPVTGLNAESQQVFLTYPWPGNIRELENCIQRALALADPSHTKLTPEDIEDRIRTAAAEALPSDQDSQTIPDGGLDLTKKLEAIEANYISQALKITSGDQVAAAHLLSVSPKKFSTRANKLGVISAE